MATKQKKTTTKKKSTPTKAKISLDHKIRSVFGWYKGFFKNDPFLGTLLTLAILAGLFLSVWVPIVIYEKYQFAQAEKSLKAFNESWVELVGEQARMSEFKSCSYRSVKFEDPGLPACSVRYSASYSVNDIAVANDYKNKFEDLVNATYDVSYSENDDFVIEEGDINAGETVYSFKVARLSCSASMKYEVPKYTDTGVQGTYLLSTYVGCRNIDSHFKYFPENK